MAENSRKNEFFERESIAIIAITREKIIILPNFKYSRQKNNPTVICRAENKL